LKAILLRRVLTVIRFALFIVCGAYVLSLPCNAQSENQPTEPGRVQRQTDDAATRKALAEKQIKAQEHQRILGIVPEFNTSNVFNAVPLTRKQKFKLAFKSATDPATFLVSGLTAGIDQAEDSYREYGQGVGGFAKYWGASYADSFDGTLLGNALFPSLLHEDPRYFRKGTGSIVSRVWYSALTTVRCRNDSGNWVPNVGNLMGNLAAGGISNLYYPEADRGAELTFQRAFIVTAEGAIGALVYEFWPDIARKARKHKTQP
jgi:hypothetical protein